MAPRDDASAVADGEGSALCGGGESVGASVVQDGAVVVDKVRNQKGSVGYNAATEEYEDLIKAGILDPTKVTRIALQNAASVAGLMITTECAIAEKPEDKEKMPPMPPGGGGGMY